MYANSSVAGKITPSAAGGLVADGVVDAIVTLNNTSPTDAANYTVTVSVLDQAGKVVAGPTSHTGGSALPPVDVEECNDELFHTDLTDKQCKGLSAAAQYGDAKMCQEACCADTTRKNERKTKSATLLTKTKLSVRDN